MDDRQKSEDVMTSGTPGSVDDRARLARDDPEAFEALLLDYRPFLLAQASRTCGRSIDPDNDEEYSTTLLAFYEAVRSYEPSRGSFLAFVRSVIRSRLLDGFRRDGRRPPEVRIDEEFDDEDSHPVDPTSSASVRAFETAMQTAERREEIARFSQELKTWNLTFRDLAEASPKASKTRNACGRMVREMLMDPNLVRIMRSGQQLPIAAICQRTGIPRKIVERHRRYIVSAVLVLTGDYPYMAEHLRWMRK